MWGVTRLAPDLGQPIAQASAEEAAARGGIEGQRRYLVGKIPGLDAATGGDIPQFEACALGQCERGPDSLKPPVRKRGS